MTVTGFNHYNLRADRATLDALRDFYVDVVGLQPGYRPPFRSFGYWLYVGQQAVLHLSEAGPDEQRDVTATNTFDHVAFSCTGLRETIARLQRLDIRFASDDVPGTGQHQLFFSDPAGNGVELNFAGEEA
jgi:catechol-2,3-dioxygenase